MILQLNGVAVNPGLKRDGVEIRKAGRFVLVDWDFGLTVRWDGEDRWEAKYCVYLEISFHKQINRVTWGNAKEIVLQQSKDLCISCNFFLIF